MSNWSDPEPTMVAGPGPVGPPGPPGPPPPMAPWSPGPPPTHRSGPNPALIVGALLLLVGAIAGGALLLTSDDDEGGRENASNREPTEQDCSQLQQQGDGEGGADIGQGLRCTDPGGEAPAPPEAPELPDVPEMPDLPEVPELPELPEPPAVPTGASVPGGDAVMALAESVYAGTPMSIDEPTSICIAEVITGVAGEGAVADAGGDYWDVWSTTSSDEDAAISQGIWENCTTVEQDADLASDANWPTSWAPSPG
jgi:hypothetical protein